jgi:hypothetical protein
MVTELILLLDYKLMLPNYKTQFAGLKVSTPGKLAFMNSSQNSRELRLLFQSDENKDERAKTL